ncbi:MAG: excisionase family DNA-binding protein [Gammaproteobacteria bacterium]
MLLTIASAAEQLCVHLRTLRRAIDRGELAVIRCGTSRKSDRIHPQDCWQSDAGTGARARSQAPRENLNALDRLVLRCHGIHWHSCHGG